MLKDNKKACKKLYKYYKKEFEDCKKCMLEFRPNFLFGLETLMLYLQYMQDTIVLTKPIKEDDEEMNSTTFTTIGAALMCYSKYKQCILEGTTIINDKSLPEEERTKLYNAVLKQAKLNWNTLWNTVSIAMEGWYTNECFMK